MSPKLVLAMVLVMLGGCAHSGAAPDKSATAKRWWPFDNASASKIAANPTLAAPKYDQKWLNEYEPRLREALQELYSERRVEPRAAVSELRSDGSATRKA